MRRSLQARVAVGMTALALGLAALVALGGYLLASRLGSDPTTRTTTRVEQIGDQAVYVVIGQNTEGAGAAQDARSDALRWVLVTLAAAFVPAAAVAWVVAGRVLRPVQQLTAVVDRVEAPDSPERTGVERPDELGDLAAGLDRMLDRLHEQQHAQQERLAEVIHELRTPLAVASVNLELARDPRSGDDATVERIDASRRAIERMARTVDDLARVGRLALDAEPGGTDVDVAVEGRALAAEHGGPAHLRGIRVVADGPDTLAVPGDRAVLRTAAGNLLSNAVRLAPGGSSITVVWGAADGWAWLAVQDEGPGIHPDDQRRVFDRYWQGSYDRARATGSDGTHRGLGLAIARQAVESQGGRLTLTSAEGRGSTFVIWLPCHAGAEVDAIDDDRLALRR
jgi:signal transduction histidine kinase